MINIMFNIEALVTKVEKFVNLSQKSNFKMSVLTIMDIVIYIYT